MSSTTTELPLDIGELQRRLTAVEPDAHLVHPRILRRIIKEACRIPGQGLVVPHRKTFVLERDRLFQFADREELEIPLNADLSEVLILIARPTDEWLVSHTNEETLLKIWRLLFHACIDRETRQQIQEGKLNQQRTWDFISRLGITEFHEISAVLRQEQYLLPPINRVRTFAELIAVYWDLRFFASPLLDQYFPTLKNREQIEDLLKEVVDADSILDRTRLEGAPDRVERKPFTEPDEILTQSLPSLVYAPSMEKCQKKLDKADVAFGKGNVVRAAILRAQAARIAPPEIHQATCHKAIAALDSLAFRLQAALELHDRETEEWRGLLPTLLEPASRGGWTVSARLLYDLQKVCVDHERDVYAVDLVQWLWSTGRRPIKRLLPHYADVLLVKHLRSAAGRLSKAPLGNEERRRLSILLRMAVHHAEQRLRDRIRPILTQVLEDVGLQAENVPEGIARRKMVEELLDRITEWGFLTMGDVRDAISRNQLKLPDLSGPVQLIKGDALIRADRQLNRRLDGVHHGGEIYLRLLQRLSSIAFGTGLGRWIMLYLVLPFGGAFATIIFVLELMHLGGIGHGDPIEPTMSVAGGALTVAAVEEKVLTPPLEPSKTIAASVTFGLGIFFLLLMHVPRFRGWVKSVLLAVWRVVRKPFWDWPSQIYQIRWIQRILQSSWMTQVTRLFLKPALSATAMALSCVLFRLGWEVATWAAGTAYLGSAIILSSRLGRHIDEAFVDWSLRKWFWVRDDLLPGILRSIQSAFKYALDWVEKVLYSVDEWLRFRPGESRLSLILKPIFGLFWKMITYVIRMVINLFVEPTFNPIKHFPAVTVAAKMMIPLFAILHLQVFLDPEGNYRLGPFLGPALEGLTFFLLPGLAGFIAWELKENWNLYKANRSKELRPVAIGSHGETMKRLLKVGFHSGTLPRAYARLRKADRQVDAGAFFKHHERLEHVMLTIRHFVEREFLTLLQQSRGWGEMPIHVGLIQSGTNCVRIELCTSTNGENGAWLSFELHSGWLVAGVSDPGWMVKLNRKQQQVLHNALAGIYKLTGVDLIHEQIQKTVPETCFLYVIQQDHLLVWHNAEFKSATVHPLRPRYEKGENDEEDESTKETTELPVAEIHYRDDPLLWSRWVAVWEEDQIESDTMDLVAPDIRFLPMEPEQAQP